MSAPIYMDYQATTPMDERVLAAMMPCFTNQFGNAASSEHRFGWEAEALVSDARERIAHMIGAGPSEIVFTSGATESNNLAILGVMRHYRAKGLHMITVETEHRAVLDPAAAWEQEGGRVTRLTVGSDGLLDPAKLQAALAQDTVLVSIMAANNEIGVIQPLARCAEITRQAGVLLHTDATQAVGKMPFDVRELGVDLVSFSGHKIYGPKGIGVLYRSRRKPRVMLAPLIHGGGHESGFRSGTLNVPGIVGLAKALELCLEDMSAENRRLEGLRDRLLAGLSACGARLNGHPTQRLAGNLNLAFPGLAAEKLIRDIYAVVAVSSSSACTSASPTPSHVMTALGGEELAAQSIRFGIGRFTTDREIDAVIQLITEKIGAGVAGA